MEKKKLFLLDAYSLIYRAYYVFIRNPRVNSKGMNTSAVYGFTNTLIDVINNQKPTHIGVVFDPSTPSFRNDIFPEYKANREETPEDIKNALPYIKKILDAFNIQAIEVDGYEADDVIGALSVKAKQKGMDTYMMTPDKDYVQLVNGDVKIFKPGRSGDDAEVMGINEVKQKYGIDDPDQIRDILALMGDSSDNIPGAKGVGEKTAKKLIHQYKTIDNLFDHIEEIKGKLKEKLINDKENIQLSKKLVTIIKDVPIDFNEKELEIKEPNDEELKKVFEELEFKSIIKRLFNRETKQSGQPQQGFLFGEEEQGVTISGYDNIKGVKHDYQLADNEKDIKKIVGQIKKNGAFCFDTETTGLNPHTASLLGIAITFKKHEAYYIPVDDKKNSLDKLKNLLEDVFNNTDIKKIGQNIKYDILILANSGFSVKGELFDTMIAHYLLQPEQKHNLDFLAEKYLNYTPVSIESLIGKKGKNQGSMQSVPIEKIVEYAGEDADLTWQIYHILEKELENNKLKELAQMVEMPLVYVLKNMEMEGVTVDQNALNNFAGKLKKEIQDVEKEIYKLAGGERFNIASTKQLGEVLFDRLKITDKPPMTKTKQYATGEDVLEKLQDKHEIIPKILEYRSLTKLLSTYVEALPRYINKKTGKIHTSYNQIRVATGRLSSDKPNLQNIPIREERGREVRKAFIPSDDNHTILAADYSQIELRLMAHMSEDQKMIDAFNNNEDIHTSTAAKIFNCSNNEVSADMRRKAKTANFGIIYGISAFGLSQRLNIPRAEAKDLIDGYFIGFPGVKKYMDDIIGKARKQGYVETIYGRRRYLRDINSRNATVRGFAERNAINAPIQGSAADIIKKAMIEIDLFLRKNNFSSKMIMQVHDELVFDIYKPELEKIKEKIVEVMQNIESLKVPLIVDTGTGNNWLEAH